jgi:hypothetical protein
MGTDCNWFVVTVDVVGIARVVEGPRQSSHHCDVLAEQYYEEHSQEGEMIQVLCEHDPITQDALQHSVD